MRQTEKVAAMRTKLKMLEVVATDNIHNGRLLGIQRGVWWALSLLGVICVFGTWCYRLEADRRMMGRIEQAVSTVDMGDSKQQVREKLGHPCKVFVSTGRREFVSTDKETWIYGRKYQSYPDINAFRRPFFVGMTRVRVFSEGPDDYAIVFDSDGRVESIKFPRGAIARRD